MLPFYIFDKYYFTLFYSYLIKTGTHSLFVCYVVLLNVNILSHNILYCAHTVIKQGFVRIGYPVKFILCMKTFSILVVAALGINNYSRESVTCAVNLFWWHHPE